MILIALVAACCPCRAEMEIEGTPLMIICQEAANASWDLWNGRLVEKPYNPGWFAWGLSYAMRAYVKLYELTGNRLWLDRAVSWADYYSNFSDVNGDGEPAWGNYNETWGTDRYDYVEFTVHDGMISVPIMELTKLILESDCLNSDPLLRSKAEGYLSLVKAVVDRHHSYWTDVTEDSGYYWNDPGSNERIIVNRFAVLGIAEMILADYLNDPRYLDKPKRMARLIKENLRHDEAADCYGWPYELGTMGAEDTSHGAIDIEFMFRAYENGLCFDDLDMQRLVNTYQRKMWQGIEMFRTGIGISARVDGSLDPDQDYTRLAKNWPLLCLNEPRILEQHRVALEVMARTRLPKDRVMAWTLAQMMDLENILENTGIDVASLAAFEPWMIEPEIEELSGLVTAAEFIGANVSSYRILVGWLYSSYEEGTKQNVSALLHQIWNAIEEVVRIKAEAYVAEAEKVIMQAKDLGMDTSRHDLFLQRAKQSLEEGYYESAENMCAYPLSLREQIGESFVPVSLMIVLFGAWKVSRTNS